MSTSYRTIETCQGDKAPFNTTFDIQSIPRVGLRGQLPLNPIHFGSESFSIEYSNYISTFVETQLCPQKTVGQYEVEEYIYIKEKNPVYQEGQQPPREDTTLIIRCLIKYDVFVSNSTSRSISTYGGISWKIVDCIVHYIHSSTDVHIVRPFLKLFQLYVYIYQKDKFTYEYLFIKEVMSKIRRGLYTLNQSGIFLL